MLEGHHEGLFGNPNRATPDTTARSIDNNSPTKESESESATIKQSTIAIFSRFLDPDDVSDFLDDEEFANSLRDTMEATIEENGEEEREEYRLQQQKVNEELDNRKGRPWRDPWEISEQQWMSSDTSSESLSDWSPSFVSRISLERLQILTIDEGMLRCVFR